MSTLSVPLSGKEELALQSLLGSNYALNKAAVLRKALLKAAEDEALNCIFQAEAEVHNGQMISGDLESLLKQMP